MDKTNIVNNLFKYNTIWTINNYERALNNRQQTFTIDMNNKNIKFKYSY